jgi:hypothetical protein
MRWFKEMFVKKENEVIKRIAKIEADAEKELTGFVQQRVF